jgi:hypothetical protein
MTRAVSQQPSTDPPCFCITSCRLSTLSCLRLHVKSPLASFELGLLHTAAFAVTIPRAAAAAVLQIVHLAHARNARVPIRSYDAACKTVRSCTQARTTACVSWLLRAAGTPPDLLLLLGVLASCTPTQLVPCIVHITKQYTQCCIRLVSSRAEDEDEGGTAAGAVWTA